GLLARFGIESSVRGTVTVAAEVGEGARAAKLDVVVHELRGDPIAQPLDIGVTATISDKTTVNLTVATREQRGSGKPPGPLVRLLTIDGTIPVSLPELVASPKAVLAKPLKVSAKLQAVPAKQLLAVFGRNELEAGTIDGTVDIAGTIGSPTVVAKLVGVGLAVPSNSNRPAVTTQITVDASWDGAAGKLVVDGTQAGGTLHVDARGTSLADTKVVLDAKGFAMMPVLAFLPGPAGSGAGTLDAHVVMTGLDPRTAKASGDLHLVDARIPISPAVGTLHSAKIDLVVRDHDITIAVDGKLGGGTVKATGTIARDGSSPTGGDVTITLRKVSPIGVVEPTIDADVTVKLRREDLRWLADVDVRNASIVVPSNRGEELKQPGAPTDMVFMNGERITRRPMKKELPTHPVIVANITLWPANLKSEEVRGIVRGKVVVTADGMSIGIVGNVQASRANLDLFSRRYRVDRAIAWFDGTTDPLLDVIISHDFPEVSTTTQVRGRLSSPELIMSSNPSTYSQGQLLGFLLGGEPSGDTQDPGDRASAVGMSFVANKIGGYMRRALPFDLDVIRYDNATALNSAAITVGTWLSRRLFVAVRTHPTSRPDENTGEGEVEYWLSRRMAVEAIAGDRGIGGIDLLWRKRY
ncbi:MAG: translocation/assembly module TamB domain-containing protein, partial [Deltaproteobacteria bacterium]|nr:translocation/assembly module TamB domain-containing protein [Deltaproteobacteria bacterium]